VDEEKLAQLYGIKRHPIYIYAPAWIEGSAGIRALHFLCHSLNQTGQLAWLIIHGATIPTTQLVSPELNTPILTSAVRDLHFRNGVAPIVIYPETIPGNPLKAQVVVRWVLNYPGALGGPKNFHENEHVIAYSSDIAFSMEKVPQVLFLPPLDIREIYRARHASFGKDRTDRVLLYAGKYRTFVGNPILPKWAPKQVTEIWKEGPNRQPREEVLELLATSSCLFVFENSTIITEAVLLGTPVILVRSTFFDSLIAIQELGQDGLAWSDQANPLDEAIASIKNVESKYLSTIKRYFMDLEKQVLIWQDIASSSDYLSPINLPNYSTLLSRHRFSLAMQILKSQGLLTLLRVVKSFITRRIKTAGL
jgi:hypothetical protein